MEDTYIGVDVGGTKTAVVLGNESGQILRRTETETKEFAQTYEWITKTIDVFLVEESILPKAIGISCGGPLDEVSGMILTPPNLPSWHHISLGPLLEDRYQLATFLQNDANACALAEWYFGGGKGYNNLVFLTFGTGMGAGLILNGSLYKGACGLAGEVGHMSLHDYGPMAYGKMGSFEGFCSGHGIAQLGKMRSIEAKELGRVSKLHLVEEKAITAKLIAQYAKEGDQLSIKIYKEVGHHLGSGLAIIVDLLNPELIIIGSIYERSGQLMETSMIQSLRDKSLATSFGACQIKAASLGDSIGDLAALTVAMEGVKRSDL